MALTSPVDQAAAVPSLRTLGTAATQAAAGNDSRLSDTRTPTDNSVTSAKIVDGAIVNADVNASAAIAYSKLNLASSIVSADITDGTIVQGDLAAALITALSGFSTAWTVIVKAIDETIAGSTTLQADDELFFTPASGGIYDLELFIIYLSASGGTTPDLKFAFGEDSTVRGTSVALSLNASDAIQNQTLPLANNSSLGAGTATTARGLYIKGHYWGNGVQAGFFFAQNTSSGAPNGTTVKAGSVFRYRRIL